MLVECYDEKGAEVYEMIIKQIFQDLLLGPSVEDLRAFVNPDEVVFILAIKMKNTAGNMHLKDVATLKYDKALDNTVVYVDDENYLPEILNKLWKNIPRENIHQPDRFSIILVGNQLKLKDLVIQDSQMNLEKRVYDAIFRILPEGFRIIKDVSKDDVIAVISTDALIKDSWIEKANEYIDELNQNNRKI